jgi:hypothetical protein
MKINEETFNILSDIVKDQDKKILGKLDEILKIERYRELHKNSLKKMVFLCECENFIPVLELLIKNDYIVNVFEKDNYIWKGQLNILAFLLLDFHYIQKLIDENKLVYNQKEKIDFREYSHKYFNRMNFRNIYNAFNIWIYDCGVNDIPDKYIELLEELGIKDKSHIIDKEKEENKNKGKRKSLVNKPK